MGLALLAELLPLFLAAEQIRQRWLCSGRIIRGRQVAPIEPVFLAQTVGVSLADEGVETHGIVLAFELAQAPDINNIAQLALAGVFEGAEIDAGAILLLPRTVIGEPSGADAASCMRIRSAGMFRTA